MRNPYDVLGVSRHASPEEIKSAFRRQAAQHHPDRNPDDANAGERFKELNEAYQVLSDPQKRAAYDRWGASAFRPGAAGPPSVSFVDLSSLDGILGDILGAMGVRTGERGTIKQRVQLTFEEAALGCTKSLTYSRMDLCSYCEGVGAEPGTESHRCPACKGRGRTRVQQGLFPLPIERFCTRCHGTGRIATRPCSRCHARGMAERSHEQSVTIPSGVAAGVVLKIAGAGNRTRRDRTPGDLEVEVGVHDHPFFRRINDDVVCTVPVSFPQAALGGELEVPTLEGTIRMKVPPGTQTGSMLRLRGKGITHQLRPGRGDQLIEVQIEVPVNLTERARALIQELGGELGDDVMPQRKSFMDRVRSWFG